MVPIYQSHPNDPGKWWGMVEQERRLTLADTMRVSHFPAVKPEWIKEQMKR